MMTEPDRRKGASLFIVQNVFLPVLISVVTGVGAAYVAVQVTLGVLETKFIYVEREVTTNRRILEGLKIQEVQLAERAVWMKYANAQIDKISHLEQSARALERRVYNLERAANYN